MFDFQISAGTNTGDGFTFTIQNNSATALGSNAGGLGYGPNTPSGASIPNSLAVKFDLYNNAGEGSDSTGVYTGGAAPTIPADVLTSSGVNLHSGDLMSATIAYDTPSQTLSVSITDLATGARFTKTYAEDLAGALGSSTAYVGFTAGTGGLTATQSIQSWVFTTLPTVANESAAPVTATEATLNASVNPNGASTTIGFEYSTDPTFTPTVQTTIGSGFSGPNGVAVDGAGDVFVADTNNNAVKEVLPDGAIKTIGSGFRDPYGAAVDGAGDVFVTDTLNNAVKEVLPDGAILTIGSGFSGPTGVAVDGAGDVFVADYNDNAVKEVLPGGAIKTIGSGSSLPYGVAVDGAGDVFVADTNNNAVKEVSPPTVTGTPSPLIGTSAQAVTGTLTGLTPDTFYFYRTVAMSAGGTTIGPLRAFNTQIATSFSGLANNPTSITYGGGSVPLSGQVVANPSLPLLAGSLVSVSINGLSETTPVNPDGTFQLDYQFAAPPGVAQSPLFVTYSFLDPNGVFASTSDSSQTLTVTPAAPNVSLNPVDLTYGTALADGQLSGTASWTVDGLTVAVPGTLSYSSAAGTVLGAGNGQAEPVAFNPNDTTDYDPVSATVLVNVAQATPTVSIAGPQSSVFGQPITFTATVAATAGDTPTGSVAFYDGPTLIGTGTLSGGTTSVSTGTLAVGSHAITADYLGDANFTTGWSSGLALSVGRDNTSLTVATSGAPSVFGQPVTFTAAVAATAPGAGMPTGTVTFMDGTNSLGTGNLDGSGTATYSTTSLSVGAHTITAVYAGDGNFAASTSAALSQVVSQDGTTAVVVSPANPSLLNQAISFTVTVAAAAPGSGTPTGTIQFQVDGKNFGSAVTLQGGTATSGSTTTLKIGSHTVTAVYGGDGNFTASTAPTLTQVVSQDNTTTALTASVNPSVFGQSVTFTATVAAVAPGSGTPTGSVTFYDGSTALKTASLSGGSTTFTTTALATASHAITAVYNGNATLATSTSSVLTETVNPDGSTTVVTSPANPSVYGQSVTFSAIVTALAPGGGTPSGSVTFLDGASTLGTATLSGGKATLKTSSLAVNTHAITVQYGGDANFTTSTSAVLYQVVNQAATTTALKSSKNPTVYGQSVTFTATVTASSPGSGTPSGSVTFLDGGNPIGTASLDGSGVATLATSSLSTTSHAITATYSGDGNFTTSTSSAVNQVVNQDKTSTALSSSVNPATIGQSVTFTATVTASSPGSGTPGTVTFDDGTTALATVTLSGGTASYSSSTLSVGTHSITALYNGDPDFITSKSSVLKETITTATNSSVASVAAVEPTASNGSSPVESGPISPPSAAPDAVSLAIEALGGVATRARAHTRLSFENRDRRPSHLLPGIERATEFRSRPHQSVRLGTHVPEASN